MFLADICMCYTLDFGQMAWWGCGWCSLSWKKKEVSPSSHSAVIFFHLWAQVRFILWFNYVVLRKGGARSGVDYDPWTMVQPQGPQLSGSRNGYRGGVGTPGCHMNWKKCKINWSSPACDYDWDLSPCSYPVLKNHILPSPSQVLFLLPITP